MQQEQQAHPEQTDTSKIDGTVHGSEYGNPGAAERYKNGLGTTGTNSVPPVGKPLSEDAQQGPPGTGIVDSGVLGGEPVQNRTAPIRPHTEAK